MKENKPVLIKSNFSIIIPVLHEADTICVLIDHLKNLDYNGKYEVIVVDGSSSKDTIKKISDKDVKTLSFSKGRAYQMNAAVAIAKGDILLFLHVDTLLPLNALNRINSAMSNTQYVGGAFDLAIDSDRIIFKIISRLISFRSHITRVPYGDQAIFIKKDHFNRLGGFKEIPIMEDLELMRRIKKSGDSIHILSEHVKTSPRRWKKEGIIRCTIRNWMIRFLYYIGINPNTLIKFYK